MRNKHGIEVRKGDLVSFMHTNGVLSGVVSGVRSGVVTLTTSAVEVEKGKWVVVKRCALDDIIRNDGRFDETIPGLLRRNNPARKGTRKMATKKTAAKKAPRRKTTAAKFASPSQATGKRPSTRLIARRKKTATMPRGVYANPSSSKGYRVQMKSDTPVPLFHGGDGRWREIGMTFSGIGSSKELAEQYAKAVHHSYPHTAVRVVKA